jgi:hypothetical protein
VEVGSRKQNSWEGRKRKCHPKWEIKFRSGKDKQEVEAGCKSRKGSRWRKQEVEAGRGNREYKLEMAAGS